MPVSPPARRIEIEFLKIWFCLVETNQIPLSDSVTILFLIAFPEPPPTIIGIPVYLKMLFPATHPVLLEMAIPDPRPEKSVSLMTSLTQYTKATPNPVDMVSIESRFSVVSLHCTNPNWPIGPFMLVIAACTWELVFWTRYKTE